MYILSDDGTIILFILSNLLINLIYIEKSFAFKNIEYVPGLYKIFDEILVNAADNV